jgi:hypothetical protein
MLAAARMLMPGGGATVLTVIGGPGQGKWTFSFAVSHFTRWSRCTERSIASNMHAISLKSFLHRGRLFTGRLSKE